MHSIDLKLVVLLVPNHLGTDVIKVHLNQAQTPILLQLFGMTQSTTLHQYIIEIMEKRPDVTRAELLALVPKAEYFHTKDLLCIAATKRPAQDNVPLVQALCADANSERSYDALRRLLKSITTADLPSLMQYGNCVTNGIITKELGTRPDCTMHLLSIFQTLKPKKREIGTAIAIAMKNEEVTAKSLIPLMQTDWQNDQSFCNLFREKLKAVPIPRRIRWYGEIASSKGREIIAESLTDSPEMIDRYMIALVKKAPDANSTASLVKQLKGHCSLETLLKVRRETNKQVVIQVLDREFEYRIKELQAFLAS